MPLATAAEDVVSRGSVVERERGEPFIAVPQTLPADVESRAPTNLTIIVDPTKTGRDSEGRRPPSDRARERRQ